MYNKQVQEMYEARNKALASIKRQLKNRGREIKSVPRRDIKSLCSDFYMNGELCKFKMTRNSQVNIIFEAMNNGNKGWLLKTKAKWFVYTIQADNVTYIINIESLRDYIDNPLHIVATTDKGAMGNNKSLSYMIPIDTLKDQSIIKEIINKRTK